MSEALNTQLVKDAYAAFGRGDVNAILAVVDDNVEWEGGKGAEGVAPQAGLRRGKPAVGEFFQQIGSTLDFQEFEPKEFVAQGDAVVAVGSYKATVKTTKRQTASDWTMIFNFRNGKIVRFREFTDSAAVIRAYDPAVAL